MKFRSIRPCNYSIYQQKYGVQTRPKVACISFSSRSTYHVGPAQHVCLARTPLLWPYRATYKILGTRKNSSLDRIGSYKELHAVDDCKSPCISTPSLYTNRQPSITIWFIRVCHLTSFRNAHMPYNKKLPDFDGSG